MALPNDPFIEKLTKVIDENLSDENFGVTSLAKELGMSRTTLHRKVKSVVKKSVSVFIRETRLKRAHELLIKKEGTVSEIAYQVGFSSATYFHTCFHNYYGYSPGEAAARNPVENSKTEPVNTKTTRIWIILAGMAAVFIIVIIFSSVLRPAPTNKRMVRIALLPFTDTSKDGEDAIIPCIREELFRTFKHVENVDVTSLANSNRYKNTDKKRSDIAKELNVNYVLTASGQTTANKTHIAFQLFRPSEQNPVWEADTVINNNEDLFGFQNSIAMVIIDQIKKELTSEEIEEKPTQQNSAYKLYQLGNDYYSIWEYNKSDEALKQARHFFQEALNVDSTYKYAYERLGWIYYYENRLYGYSTRDSAMLMAEKAINLDSNFTAAYSLMGFLYISTNPAEAESTFKKALKITPEDSYVCHQLGNLYHELEDFYNGLNYLLKALQYNKEPIFFKETLIDLCGGLSNSGYFDEAETYAKILLKQHNDSTVYYNLMQYNETLKGNFQNSINYGISALSIDSLNTTTIEFLGFSYLLMNDSANSYNYYKKYYDCLSGKFPQILNLSEYEFAFRSNFHNSSTIYTTNFPILHSAWSFMKINEISKADNYFNGLINSDLSRIEKNKTSLRVFRYYIEMACIYSARGNKANAIHYLMLLKKQKTGCLWLVHLLKYSPMLDNIRNEPEFTDVLNDAEAKYQILHKQVGELLTKSDPII